MKLMLTILTLVAMLAAGPAFGEAIVYEGFDYDADSALVGQNGGLGWAGPWIGGWGDSPVVRADGLSAGSLLTAGGRAESLGHSKVSRPIGSALSDAGLMADGATVWFSLIADLDTGRNPQNVFNLDYNLALGTDELLAGWGGDGNGNERYSRRNHMMNMGEGIGLSSAYVWGGSDWVAQYRAAYWQDNGDNDNDEGNGPDGYGNLHIADAHDGGGISTGSLFLVGKIEWGVGGAGETISLYMPDAGGLGDAVQTTTTPDLNQSAFDTLAIQWKDSPGIDEIRFGATAADVTPVPEPSTLCLVGVALLGLVALRRRK